MGALTQHERHIAVAIAAVAIPGGDFIPEGGATAVARMEASLDELPPWAGRGLRALLVALDLAPLPTHGLRFTGLSTEARASFLDGWQTARYPQARQILRALLSAIKAAHFDDPGSLQPGCRLRPQGRPREGAAGRGGPLRNGCEAVGHWISGSWAPHGETHRPHALHIDCAGSNCSPRSRPPSGGLHTVGAGRPRVASRGGGGPRRWALNGVCPSSPHIRCAGRAARAFTPTGP